MGMDVPKCTCGAIDFRRDIMRFSSDRGPLEPKTVVVYYCANCEKALSFLPLDIENLPAAVRNIEATVSRLETLVRGLRSRPSF